MKRLTVLAVTGLLAASCATAPTTSTPEKPTPAKTMSYQVALPTLDKSYFPNGDPSGSVQTTYDSMGRIVLQETSNGNGTVIERKTGAANGNAWRITTINTQSDELVSYEDFTYDSQGQVLSDVYLNPKGVPQTSNLYQYNKDGVKTEWIAKTGDAVQARTEYLLDSSGHNVKTEVYDGADHLSDVFSSKFSSDGHLLTTDGTDASGNVIEKTTFTWSGPKLVRKESLVPFLRTWDYVYTTGDEPSQVTLSVRGKVAQKDDITYVDITRTKNL